MKVEDPITLAVYDALTLLPAAGTALTEVLSHERCEARHRRLAEHLLRQVHDQRIFSDKDRRDVGVLVSELRHWIKEGTQRLWVHDENCMSGGWYETVISSDLAGLKEQYLMLDSLQTALQRVHDIVQAHRLACQLSSS